MNQHIFSFKANSHILSLLGDELIGSDNLAIFELVKNSYDADASHVKIIFDNINTPEATISYESECILAKYKNKSIEYELYDIPLYLEGREREIIVRQRVNQSFFRKMILASYNNKCCVTGSNYVSLLSACHIKPWNKDVKNRMNPQNGLCMNILLHYSFDQGLFTITNDYRILLSREVYSLNDPFMSKNLLSYENCKITLPQKFIPEKVFLEYHYDTIFKK